MSRFKGYAIITYVYTQRGYPPRFTRKPMRHKHRQQIYPTGPISSYHRFISAREALVHQGQTLPGRGLNAM
ncbi:MAG: hypothetical protein ABL864_01900 [Terricaulis sp.]